MNKPKDPEKRTQRKIIRFVPEHLERLKSLAIKYNVSIGSYILYLAKENGKKPLPEIDKTKKTKSCCVCLYRWEWEELKELSGGKPLEKYIELLIGVKL